MKNIKSKSSVSKKIFCTNTSCIICGAICIVLAVFSVWIFKQNVGDKLDWSGQRIFDVNMNAEEPLRLESAYHDIEAIHPKAVCFHYPWNGYRYWLSFSPYPKADDAKENPHILASNDLKNWIEPDGFKNPLDNTPPNYEHAVVYNSDPELFYNEDTGELECWWRFVDDSEGKSVVIYRRCSSDGIHWTEKEVMISGDRVEQDYVSLSIIYEDGIYKMWSIGSGYQVQYMESNDGWNWSDIRFIDIAYPSVAIKNWHISVIHTEKGYEMVLSSFDSALPKEIYPRGVMNLYYTWSNDNIIYRKVQVLLGPSMSDDAWDNKGLYRSSLLQDTDGQYYLFYSAIGQDGVRGCGLLQGSTIPTCIFYNTLQ